MDEYRFGPAGEYRLLAATDAASRERALSLVYGVYLSSGLAERRHSHMQISVHDLMPETTSLLVERDPVMAGGGAAAVGSLTLIPDGPMDLPLDSLARTALNALRVAGRQPLELAKLATVASTEHRAGAGRAPREEILLHLFRAGYLIARELADATDLVVAIAPHQEGYFRRVLLFDPLGEPPPGAEGLSIPMVLPLDEADDRYRKRYGHRRAERNLYAFFRNEQDSEVLEWLRSVRRPLSAADVYRLFAERCPLLQKVDEVTRRMAIKLYPGLDKLLATGGS